MRKPIPKYVRHKARNCGKVTIHGKTHYLPGEFNSEESKTAYGRLLAEYLTGQATPDTANVTLRYLSVQYMKYCREYYVDEGGKELNEVRQIRLSLKPLLAMFGSESAMDFGPRKLKHVRERIIDTGITRGVINDRIGRIIRMLRWGAAEEYVPASVVQACRELRNLQAGRCGDIPEQRDVKPVTLEQIEAVRGHLTSVLRGMVDLELLTGMRPQEVRNMTWGQIDRSDSEAWCYEPSRHKTKRRGKRRRIFIGPEGQRVLRQFLKADPDAFIFSPQDSEAERFANLRKNRTTPLTPSQKLRGKRARTRVVANQYNKDSLTSSLTLTSRHGFPWRMISASSS